MVDALHQVKDYLQRQYAQLDGRPNWTFQVGAELESGKPVWAWQTSDLRRVNSAADANGAVLLDPDIGICLFLQKFDEKIPVRQQISKALQIRSTLLPTNKRKGDAQSDGFGSWRVLLHWLITKNELPKWVEQVSEIREQTAHFEEVPVDAIVRGEKTWAHAAQAHGFPRLLLRVRSVLKRSKYADVERWQSADRLVVDSLSGLVNAVSDPIAQQAAAEVAAFVDKRSSNFESPSQLPAEPTDLRKLSIENFRNIDQLTIDFRTAAVGADATVIQGPNGSGKSSVFEALSIAVSHASWRYEAFLSDKNRSLLGRGDTYRENYLSALTSENREARLGLNGAVSGPIELAPDSEHGRRLQALGGTFLSQDSSRAFVRMTASDLGGEIAAGLSAVASDVQQLIGSRLAAADGDVKAFNAKWGLRANVTKRETVLSQISLKEITSLLPNLSELLAWLESSELSNLAIFGMAKKLALRWREWQSAVPDVANSLCSELMLEDLGSSGSGAALAEHFIAENQLISETGALFSDLTAKTVKWSVEIEGGLQKWAAWLGKHQESGEVTDSQKIVTLRETLKSANDALSAATGVGKLLAEQLEQLERISSFIANWAREHKDTCPVCDSDVSMRGGIAAVTDAGMIAVRRALQEARADYAERKRILESTANQLETLGAAQPPVTPEEQSQIIEIYAWLRNDADSFEDLISNDDEVRALLGVMRHIRVLPRLPSKRESPRERAAECFKKLVGVSTEHARVSRLPDAWKAVQKEVQRRLVAVTASHLPQTLQALWLEIARSITPAPWQHPGAIEFYAGSRQSGPEAAVVIRRDSRTVLASHILNGAEIHNLGLAWFFTKYLTQGRFTHSFIVLDDPSDAMDQTTFRDLCRFLETLLRLHRVWSLPLSLVVMLHEDQRALDVARATGAVLYQLKWNRETKILSRPLQIYGAQMAPPLPVSVLEAG